MKRSDRLVAIILALQQRAETALSLAKKLEVSQRTIIRDIQSLSEIGVPVYSQTGPSGGYRLMDTYRLEPLQFESKEALAILLALKTMLHYADTPFNRERWTAYDKIKAILPREILKQIDPLLDNIEVEVPKRRYKTPYLEDLLLHVVSSTWIESMYRSQKERKMICIMPTRLYANQGFWYCDAFSQTHGESRVFRVDRLESLSVVQVPKEITNELIKREEQNHAKSVHQEPTRIQANLTYKGMILVEQDPHIGEQIVQVSEHLWKLDFQCPPNEIDWLIHYFFSLGLDVEVLEPLFIRERILDISKEMCVRYQNR